MPRTRAYVGLGSNLGDARGDDGGRDSRPRRPAAHARGRRLPPVRDRARRRPRPARVPQRRRRVRLTTPGGELGAVGLLAALKGLERAFGRQARPAGVRASSTLDLLVFGRMGGLRPADPGHRVARPGEAGPRPDGPAPEAQRRLFVLAPLADLAPGLVPPGWGETVATAAARRRVEEGEAAVRPIARGPAAGRPSLGAAAAAARSRTVPATARLGQRAGSRGLAHRSVDGSTRYAVAPGSDPRPPRRSSRPRKTTAAPSSAATVGGLAAPTSSW